MISDYVGDLIASNILTSLADPCKIEDTSWLKPGKTTFPWWCDSACADSTFQWGNNFPTNAYFVDFADINDYVAIARRKGDSWYLGAITGLDRREIDIDLDFLGEGQWIAEILTDAPDVDKDPNKMVIEKKLLTSSGKLTLKLGSEGGAAVKFSRQD